MRNKPKAKTAWSARHVRHMRIRQRLQGTDQRPRMSVFRSLKNTYVQVIDDASGHTLVSANTRDAGFEKSSKVEAARQIGKLIAEKAVASGIVKVVFDRGGYKYHGRVKELAEAAREGGLDF